MNGRGSDGAPGIMLHRRVHRRLHREARRRHATAVRFVVFVGGAIGALARYALGQSLPAHPGGWPWGTFVANLAGTFLLGLVATRLVEGRTPSAYRLPLLATGVCGALTTFSTLQVEALTLGRDGHVAMATVYVAVSVAAGLVCIAAAGHLVRAHRRATAR